MPHSQDYDYLKGSYPGMVRNVPLPEPEPEPEKIPEPNPLRLQEPETPVAESATQARRGRRPKAVADE